MLALRLMPLFFLSGRDSRIFSRCTRCEIVRRIDRVYVATHKADLRLTRICVASIRHWNPDLPLFLLKDETSGAFSTREIESTWGAQVWPTERRAFGWGFIKLEPLFASESTHYLMLDSDIVLVGPLIQALEKHESDFIVHDELQPDDKMRDLYFDPIKLRQQVDPAFPAVPFTFNTGQYVATSGLLTRQDFDSVLDTNGAPRVRFPNVFNPSEQGVLNYIVLKRLAEGSITVSGAQFMKWGETTAEIELAVLTQDSPYAALIHWAGLKKWRLGRMLRSDILRYFEREYYGRVVGGQARLHARIVRADVERLGRMLQRRSRAATRLFRRKTTEP